MSRILEGLSACAMTCLLVGSVCAQTPAAEDFVLQSTDVAPGKPVPFANTLDTYGCTGGNRSPQLIWSGAPKDTKSFVLTVFDADVPSGSGWWHWVVYDIPANTTELPAAIGKGGALPAGAKEGRTDGGKPGYGGPCPPQGAPAHRYIFTLHALKVDKLPVPPEASAALIGLMANNNRIGQASFTVLHQR